MSRKLTLCMLALAISSVALAADKPAAPVKTIGWEEFKARCADKNQFDDQKEILNAVISCTDVRKEFVSATPADVPLQGSRQITAGLISDKFAVANTSVDVPVNAQAGSCLRFKEVEKTYTFQRSISCSEIGGIKADLASFCTAALDKGKAENPKGGAEVRETGRVIDTCAGVEHVERSKGNGKPGKGKKD